MSALCQHDVNHSFRCQFWWFDLPFLKQNLLFMHFCLICYKLINSERRHCSDLMAFIFAQNEQRSARNHSTAVLYNSLLLFSTTGRLTCRRVNWSPVALSIDLTLLLSQGTAAGRTRWAWTRGQASATGWDSTVTTLLRWRWRGVRNCSIAIKTTQSQC